MSVINLWQATETVENVMGIVDRKGCVIGFSKHK